MCGRRGVTFGNHTFGGIVVVALALAMPAAAQTAQLAAHAPSAQPYFDFQVDKPVASRPGNPHPRYRADMRATGRPGEVVAQFVVDTTGRVDMTTFEVVQATNASFTAAVRAVLPDTRYLPAETGGRKVRQRAQQHFLFASGQ